MEEEKVTPNPKYFQFIYDQLSEIEKHVPWANPVLPQLQLLKMDVRFLKAFCFGLEAWDYTTDEESIEKLRSMITPFQVIWPKEYIGLSLAQTFPIDILDFNAMKFELEAKIQQSKQQVEGWCENLMHSSMKCKPSTFSKVWYNLQHLLKNLNDFSNYRAAKIVPLKKQIDIFKANIEFLGELFDIVKRCPYEKDILKFLNFVGDFANIAACLTSLYWAKESNEEIVTELNIVMFDMLRKFIPFACDITPLYIGILESYDLQRTFISFFPGEVVEGFVDFFFGHLVTTMKDDYLILRDRLIFLSTFLTDPPCQNAEEIRSQIYALFHEDPYFLLPFDEMKDDLSDKKMLLNDCMLKIDVASTKIRQLYCGFSDSWIRLEVEKMEYMYIISVQRELSSIEKHARWAHTVLDQLQLYKMELRLLRVFLLCFATWDDTGEDTRVKLSSMIASFQEIWGKTEENGLFLAPRFHAIRSRDITDWHQLASELEEKIQLSKLKIEEWWVSLFHWSFRCKLSTSYKSPEFLNSILGNLKALVTYKAGEINQFKKQIEILEEKLVFLKNFIELMANCKDCKELEEFNMFVQVIANDAACLTYLYWAKDENDKNSNETNSMLSHMLQKMKPTTPDLGRMYFGTLTKAICVEQSNSLMFGRTAFTFVNLLLEDLVTPLKDDFQILQDNIVFLLTFLFDSPNTNAEDLLFSQVDVLFWESVYGLLPFDVMEGDFSKKIVLLRDFVAKIETINASIRQIHGKFPDSSLYNFPKVVSPRFLDFLIHNLRKLKERMISDRKYAPFAKYKIIKIEEELIALCPFFNHIFDLQGELNETWLEVVNLLHLAEHVINSCISSWFVFDHPMWYHMAYLSDVFDAIKVVKTKLEKIKENKMYNGKCLPCSAGFISTILEQARPSEMNEILVGFEDEAETIIEMLTRGHVSFDIVSIVGMGGLGKTTLAKKVFGSSLVKSNFDVLAFCSVSQDHNTRRLLFDILCDIKMVDKRNSDMTEDDLAHQLWKCLSRQKYLIVLDDIWSVSVWNRVKSSFPDDKNGSRVMLTTRSHEVADKCKINCSPHRLGFLSEVESWELLQKKVFYNGISPPHLNEIGRLIAKNCKGLPLAVVVIAGLLVRTQKSLRWWSEVADKVVSYLSDEGCMQILELSYKHLPENLKTCLLYLGAFPEGRVIMVSQVIMPWIAEGFIQESKTKSIEDVANDYFHDLVDRSLVIVNTRRSNGEIKSFRVHDLIHDLCRTKCRDGNFFLLNHGIASSSSSDPSVNNHYRVSTQKEIDAGSSLSNIHSLLYFCERSDCSFSGFPLRELKNAQVLDLDLLQREYDIKQLSSLVHLRHVQATLHHWKSIPSSISNLWNIGSLILTLTSVYYEIDLPETLWRMNSLRHVKVIQSKLNFLDGYEEHEACPKLDKVVSFSKPILSTGKDVQRLLQRLPAVQKLSCFMEKSLDDDVDTVETLDFYRKLESLKLTIPVKLFYIRKRNLYAINFPSTLKELTLVRFQLPWTAISEIAELHFLQVLKLKWISLPEPSLDTEDLAFQNLKFFELHYPDLVEWNASIESFPCLEQLVIECPKLEELPPCFGEMSTLRRIVVRESLEVESSALRIQEEQKELGNQVEVSSSKRKTFY